MEPHFFTVNIAIHRVPEVYQVEISHSDPNSQTQMATLRGPMNFDMQALQSLQLMDADYGKALAEQLFFDAEILQRFIQVETAAEASDSFLRVILCIDPSAQELHGLRWELLRHPQTGALLSTSERVLFSRLISSREWRPVRLRARTELSVLIAISAPNSDKLRSMQLTPVNYEDELERVRAVFEGIEVRSIGGPGSPLTLDRLIDELHDGVDILYIVCHGMFARSTGTAALILQDDAGEAMPVRGEDLAARITDLQKVPRLVVLVSCQSAGDGEPIDAKHRTTAQSTIGTRLADAGVPGVIAMQGFITRKTIEKMMPTFFVELLRDGQIDRALAAARGKVRDRPDAWMPALFTRLTMGRLWYTPGFRSDKAEDVWRQLVKPVVDGKVVPIIGPRLLEAAHGDSHSTAERLAGASRYPLSKHDLDDLPRVTEYMSVKESRYNVIRAYQDQLLRDLIKEHRNWLPRVEIPPAARKPKLGKLLAMVGDHLRERETDAYRILAELPASVYVTTNFDPLLERALRAKQREPQQVLTRWRYKAPAVTSDTQAIVEPNVAAPLVYHVFGAFGSDNDDGLVLTEDDYFDYLIQTAQAKLIPREVESALVDNSLLFLGFRLTDWHFRVLFRLMMNLPGRDRLKRYCHVAVQLDPDMQTMADVEGAKEYLATYFGQEANIDIYWGSSEEFLAALREAVNSGETLDMSDQPAVDPDEWCF